VAKQLMKTLLTLGIEFADTIDGINTTLLTEISRKIEEEKLMSVEDKLLKKIQNKLKIWDKYDDNLKFILNIHLSETLRNLTISNKNLSKFSAIKSTNESAISHYYDGLMSSYKLELNHEFKGLLE